MISTWGSGNMSTDWNEAAQRVGNAILEVNSDWLLFIEGIGNTENNTTSYQNIINYHITDDCRHENLVGRQPSRRSEASHRVKCAQQSCILRARVLPRCGQDRAVVPQSDLP